MQNETVTRVQVLLNRVESLKVKKINAQDHKSSYQKLLIQYKLCELKDLLLKKSYSLCFRSDSKL